VTTPLGSWLGTGPCASACISHRTLRVALWRRLFSLPRRLSSRRLDRDPLPQHVSARVPRRQPRRLRHEQLAQCRLKGDEKSGLASGSTPLRSWLGTGSWLGTEPRALASGSTPLQSWLRTGSWLGTEPRALGSGSTPLQSWLRTGPWLGTEPRALASGSTPLRSRPGTGSWLGTEPRALASGSTS
jgi:hypothetical protein